MGKITRKGITARETSFLIDFRWNGKRYQERLALEPTPANWKYAEQLRKKILHHIEMDTFNFAEFFPESKHAATVGKAKLPLFSKVAEQWLESHRRNIAVTTFREYRNTLSNYFSREYENKLKDCIDQPLNDRVMADISIADIDSFMASLDVANRTYNNVLSPLKMIFEYAVDRSADTGVTVNCAKKVKFLKPPKAKPDPLEPEEMKKILADMAEHYSEQIEIYFALAFRIGFRPSEGIALQWGDIDWNKKELKIARARVWGELKGLKTEGILKADEGDGRIVEIDDDCIVLLNRLRKHTQMKGEWLFLTKYDQPYKSTDCMMEDYWRPSLIRCKIRERDARQTRHTCATFMLMSGAHDTWSARQLGHTVEMFRNTYSKWTPEMDNRRQLAKLSEIFKKEPQLHVVGEQNND